MFEIIKASIFFPTYCPAVKNWKHKLRGTDGNKKRITFSEEDKKHIQKGIERMCKELSKSALKGL